jgi:NADH-quinone oxidoreductase subunit N
MTGTGGVTVEILRWLLPEMLLVAAASLLLVLDLVVRKKDVIGYAAAVACVVAAAGGWLQAATVEPVVLFDGMLVIDGYSQFFKLLFLATTVFTVLLSIPYLRLENSAHGESYALLLFATSGMMIMASAGDLITLYLGIELMALSSYVLVASRLHDPRSNEAAIKYLLLGGFSSAFLLYGVALLYGLTGTTSLPAIAELLAGGDETAVYLPLVLVLVGFAFKIGAVPFHMWVPDVYEGAPTAVTAFLSVGPKAAAFAALGRVFYEAFGGLVEVWAPLLAFLAVLSMAVGNLMAIAQSNLKRMLAYSSIAHAGYALIGLVAGSREGVTSAMVYLVVYGLMNIGAFSVVVAIRRGGVEGEQLSDYRGLSKTHPLLASAMLVFMFSLVGIPPTAGFVGKFFLFREAIAAGWTPLAVVAVIFSVVSAFYYLRVVVNMYMQDPEQEVELVATVPLVASLAVATVLTLALGVVPGPLLELAVRSMEAW